MGSCYTLITTDFLSDRTPTEQGNPFRRGGLRPPFFGMGKFQVRSGLTKVPLYQDSHSMDEFDACESGGTQSAPTKKCCSQIANFLLTRLGKDFLN